MSDNLSIDLGDYGKFSQQELKEQYGDNWLQAVEKLNGSFNTEYGAYSYQEMYDTYGDKIPEALDALSGKKKAQEEESEEPVVEQPSMDSSSEAGSSESQESRGDDIRDLEDWREEGVKSVRESDVEKTEEFYTKPFEEAQAYVNEKLSAENLEKTDAGDLAEELINDLPEEMVDTYIMNTIEDRASEEVSKEFSKNVEEVKGILPNTVDYSANTLDEVTDNLPDEILDKVDSDVLAQAVAEKRAEAFDNLANQSLFDKYNEYKNKYLSKYDKNMSDALAKEDLATEMIGKELSLLGFDKEELAKYQDAVIELDKLRRNPVDPKSPEYSEYVTKVRDLDAVVSEAREISDKQFMNPETGVIDENAKKESDDAVAKVVKEHKNDYNKLKTSLDKNIAKQDYLESRIREITGKEELDVRAIAEIGSTPFGYANSEDILTADVYFNPEKEDKLISLIREYTSSLRESKVLSKALLLNEDVTATAKGFELLDGTNLDWLGKGIVSASETLYEGLLDKDYLSENDYASIVSDIANKEGVELTSNQIKRAEKDLSQKISEATGSSLAIGAEILLTRNLVQGAAGFISLPSKLAKMKYVKDALTEGTKLNKMFNYTKDLVFEDLAFQLADDDLGIGMGSAEKLSEDAFEKLAEKLAGGKLGKFTKLLDNYVTRVARKTTARTVGGTFSEYAGDFVNQGIKDGFFTEQQFKDVFGEGDEAVEKFIITASIAGGIGLPSTFVSSIKNKSSENSDLDKLIKTYEETADLKTRLEKGQLTEADLEVLTAEREKAESEEVTTTQEVTPEAEVIEEAKVETTTEEEVVTEPTVETEAEPVVEAEPTTEVEGDTFTEEVDLLSGISEEDRPSFKNELKEIDKRKKRIAELELEGGRESFVNRLKKSIAMYESKIELKKQSFFNKYNKQKQEQNEIFKRKEEERKRLEQQQLKLEKDASYIPDLKTEKSSYADLHSDKLGGQSYELNFEGEKPIGLVEGYSALTGEVLYSAYKGALRTRGSLSSYTGDMFTQGELKVLKDLESKLKAESQLKAKNGSPFKIKNSDVVSTPSVSDNISKLTKALKSAFGLDGVKILVTTDQDLNSDVFNEFNLNGEYGRVRSAKLSSLDSFEKGATRRIKDGEHYIYIDSSLTPEQQSVILSHEFGHILQKERFDKLSKEEQDLVKNEYDKWYSSLTGKTIREVREEVSDVSIWELMNDSERSYESDNSYDKYLSSFKEWFADNVSKYVSSSKKPKTTLEKFFYDIYNSLKIIYDSFKKKNKLFPEFEKWLDSVFDAKKAEEVLSGIEKGYTGEVSKDKNVSLEKDSSSKKGKKSPLEKKKEATLEQSKKVYDKAKASGLDIISAAKKAFNETYGSANWFKNLSPEEKVEVENDFYNESVEMFENPSPEKNQIFTKPKRKKGVVTKVSLLKSLRDQGRVDARARRAVTKTISEAQKEFKSLLDAAFSIPKDKLSEAEIKSGKKFSLLSDSQKNTANSLLLDVKDAKTLAEAKIKLANLIEYGAVKPGTKTILTAKNKRYVTIADKTLNKALLKAETEGAKGLSKAQKELVKDLRDKIKSLGSQSQSVINSIAKRLVNVNPSSPSSVLELHDYLDKVKADSDYRAKRIEAKNTKIKLKKALASARKKHGNKLGIRGQIAETFSKMNLSRVSDPAASVLVMEQMIESFNNPTSFSLIKEEADRIISDYNKAQEEFQNKKIALEEESLKEEYEKSSMKDIVDFEKFKEIKAKASAEDKSAKRLEKEEELRDSMKKYLSDRIDYIKSNIESITKDMSRIEIAAVKDLINSASLLSRSDILSSAGLLSLHNAIDEVVTYNSASGTAKISSILKAVKKSKKAEIVGKGKMDRGLFGRSKSLGNLSTYAKAITQDTDTALKLSSILFGDYNRSFQKVKQMTEAFLEKRAELRDKLGIEREGSAKIGIISRLLQSEPGSTSEEMIEDVKLKIESIKNQIAELKEQKSRKYKREADFLQEAFDALKLDDINYDGSVEDIFSDIESRLSPNEKQFLDFLESEFSKIRPDLESSYRVNKGAELDPVNRYIPTSSYRLSTKAEPEEFVTRESLNVTPSGRTIKRKKTNVNSMYNYDVLSVTEQGYSDAMNDIHTLGDRDVLVETVKSQPVRDLFIGKGTGKEEYRMYDALVSRVSTLMKKRNVNHDSNSLRASSLASFGKSVFNSILAAPLRKTDQVVRQTLPILINTMGENAPATVKAFGYMSSTLASKKNRENVKKLFKYANTDIRILNGDASMSDVAGLNEKAVRYIMKQTELGRKIDKKILSKIGSGALGFADQMAAGGSWLAFYIEARTKQEGKGFKFDMEKEANNPNKEAIDNANTKSDWINNKSDVTTDGGALELKNLPGAAKAVKDLLFLFKSFAMNASYRTALDLRNVRKGLFRGDLKTVREGSRSILATVGSMVMFELLKENFLSPVYDDIVDEILGAEDPDPEKEPLNFESWAEGTPGAAAKALMDLLLGWTPDGTDSGIKYLINKLALDKAKEEYKEKKEFNDMIGFPTPKFDPFSEKLFYDQFNGPGSVNRFLSVGEDLFEDYGILSGDETFTTQLGHLTMEEEYDLYSKFLTAIHATSVITGNADVEILTKKYKRNKKKEKEKK